MNIVKIINILIYFAILLSIYLIYEKSIKSFFWSNFRFKHKQNNNNRMFIYIKRIFQTLFKDKNNREICNMVNIFYIMLTSIFLVVYIIMVMLTSQNGGLFKSILMSLFPSSLISIIPIIIIRIKLYEIQRLSSREAMLVVTEILNQYKMFNNNILEAIDRAVINFDDDVICKSYIVRLSIKLKQYKSNDELIDILEEFVFSVNTNWIKMLSNSIYFSLSSNIDVTLSLEELIKQIGVIEKTNELSKRLNNEGFIMAKFFAPVLYITLIIICVKMLNMNLSNIMIMQFTGSGLKMFLCILLLYILCLICEYTTKNKKYDF